MKNKLFLACFFATFLFNGYPTIKGVQANQSILIAQQSIWKEFSSQEGGFKVLLPGTPTQTKDKVNTRNGSIPTNVFVVGRQNEAVYVVGYADFPKNISLTSREVQPLLPQLNSRRSAQTGVRVVSQRTLRLKNVPGREIRLQDSQGVSLRVRTYAINKRLYQVAVITNKEASLTKSIEGFFNSFQLTANSAASAAPKKPSMAELNTSLKQSVCSQNWSQAIKVINQMVAIAPSPEERNQLVTYRSQLEGLANSNSKIPSQSLPECNTQR